MLYKDLSQVVNIIKNIELDINKSLSRRRFIKLLTPELENYNETAQDIRTKYAEKEKDGKKKIIDNKIQYKPESKKLATKEIEELQNKEAVIDFSKNQEDLKTVISILEDLKTKTLDTVVSEIDHPVVKLSEKMTDKDYIFIEVIEQSIETLKNIK